MTEDKKEPTDQKRQGPEPKRPADPPDCIYLTPYPNVIFLYPTCCASLVAAVWLSLRQGVETTAPDTIPVALTTAFLCVFAINLVVLSVDFPRATSLTLFFVVSTLGLGAAVLLILRPDLVPPIRDVIVQLRPVANGTFFWIISGVLAAMFVLVKIKVQFNYWEVRRNEILHHHGLLSDLRRYPATGVQIEKEINDVFEYFLLRSGRLILRPQGENRAFVLENVPFIGTKEEQVTRMLSAVKVKVQTEH